MHDAAAGGAESTAPANRELRLAAVCIGRAEKLAGKSFKTGINKIALDHPVTIGPAGVVGDSVCNGKYHGGPEQAVLLEGAKTLDWWGETLGRSIPKGLFGENVVISNLDNRDVAAGDIFRIGDELILQATSPRTPCGTLTAHIGYPEFAQAYRGAARPGIYCRVLKPGIATVGDRVEHVLFDGIRIPIPEMLKNFGKRLSQEDVALYLSAPVHARLKAAILASGKAKFYGAAAGGDAPQRPHGIKRIPLPG